MPNSRSIHEELRQTRPFHSKGQEAFLAMLRTADMAKHRFSTLFEKEGVTFQQYNVLRILRGADEKGLPTLEIGERMIERTPGVTRIVDRLEKRGWVVRVRGREDRRRVWCRITDEGRALLLRLDEPVEETDDSVFVDLSETELQTLIDTLGRIRAGMDRAGCGGAE